jgi:hypothetical protein
MLAGHTNLLTTALLYSTPASHVSCVESPAKCPPRLSLSFREAAGGPEQSEGGISQVSFQSEIATRRCGQSRNDSVQKRFSASC